MNRESLKVWLQFLGLLVVLFVFGAAVLSMRKLAGH